MSDLNTKRCAASVVWMLLLACAALAPGCESPMETTSVRQQFATAGSRPAEKETVETAPAPTKPAGPSVATINGQPISQRRLVRALMESRGLIVLQQLLLLEAAKQETQRLGLVVGPNDVDEEYEFTLNADRFDGRDKGPLTPARREMLIQDWTASRGVSRGELQIAMERQAHLRKIARTKVKITDEMVRHEFEIRHGERLEVRHIQVEAPRVWTKLKARLDAGEDFEKLVRDFSVNAVSRERDGLLPPFAAEGDPTVPATFAKVASQLKPGEASNLLEAEGGYHVLKLVRKIPPDDLSFESAEPSLRQALEARLLAEQIEQEGQRLLMRARIEIDDSLLRRQYEERRSAGRLIGPPLVDSGPDSP